MTLRRKQHVKPLPIRDMLISSCGFAQHCNLLNLRLDTAKEPGPLHTGKASQFFRSPLVSKGTR